MPGKLNKNSFPAQDPRHDLGYSTLNPKYHLPRTSNTSFPYSDPDDEDVEDVFVDPESIEAVGIKNPEINPIDFLDINKTDNFYYVGSATKLKEVGTSISPLPDLYKNKEAISGGTSAITTPGPALGFRSKIRPTGSKSGWSKSLPDQEVGDDRSFVGYQAPEDDNLKKLRLIISNIHAEEQKAGR